MLITKLNNGVTVMAKMTKDGLVALGYSNRTQADRKAATLPGATVRRFMGRPFYVVIPAVDIVRLGGN